MTSLPMFTLQYVRPCMLMTELCGLLLPHSQLQLPSWTKLFKLLQPGLTLGAFVFQPLRPLLLFSLTSVTLPLLLPCSLILPLYLMFPISVSLSWPLISDLHGALTSFSCETDAAPTFGCSQSLPPSNGELIIPPCAGFIHLSFFPNLTMASFFMLLLLPLYSFILIASNMLHAVLFSVPCVAPLSIAKLEAEAHLMPLATRRQQLLSLYGCRVLSIPSHPVRQILLHYFPIQDFLSTSYCIPALGRLADEFAFLHLTPSCFPNSPMFLASYVIRLLHCLFFPLWLALIKTHFLLPNGSPSFTILLPIIRAGLLSSLMDLKVSMVAVVLSGVVHLLSSLTSLLPLLFSLLNSAIYSALKFLQNIDGQYVLYSDSLSCIRALQSLAPSSHYLISKIVSLLLSLPSLKVVIEWVPSHLGIPGNDKADHLARTAITHHTHHYPELRPVITSSYYQLSDHWTSLPLPLRSFKPNLMPTAFTDILRLTQVGLTRLRLGVCLLTHRHLFSHLPRVTCFRCLCPVTIEHMLLLCPSYVGPRLKSREVCQRLRLTFDVPSLLSPPFPAECLLNYLQAIRFLSLLYRPGLIFTWTSRCQGP